MGSFDVFFFFFIFRSFFWFLFLKSFRLFIYIRSRNQLSLFLRGGRDSLGGEKENSLFRRREKRRWTGFIFFLSLSLNLDPFSKTKIYFRSSKEGGDRLATLLKTKGPLSRLAVLDFENARGQGRLAVFDFENARGQGRLAGRVFEAKGALRCRNEEKNTSLSSSPSTLSSTPLSFSSLTLAPLAAAPRLQLLTTSPSLCARRNRKSIISAAAAVVVATPRRRISRSSSITTTVVAMASSPSSLNPDQAAASASASAAPTPRALSKRPRLLVVSDLDWTMVDHDDKEHAGLREFNALWRDKFSEDSLLVFSTGRSHALYEQLRKEVPALAVPDVLICSVGTEIFFENETKDGEGIAAAPVPDSRWTEALDATGWSRAAVAEAALASTPALRLQAESEQRPHKVSFHLEGGRDAAAGGALRALDDALKELRFGTTVIYSGGVDVDVLPAGAAKGAGLRFLLSELAVGPGAPERGVVAAGDSGNDVELLAAGEVGEGEGEGEGEGAKSAKGRVSARCPPGVLVRGVVVANAHPELRAWAEGKRGKGTETSVVFEAKERCARGIVEALRHFDLA